MNIKNLADVTTSFTQRAAQYQTQAEQAHRRFNQISVVRTLAFVLVIIGVVYFANARQDTVFWPLLLISVVSFPLLIRYHNRLRTQRNHRLTLQKINEDELKRLDLQLTDFTSGALFYRSQHPYSGDLDIFGDHSLFQLLNRSATQQGQFWLARWLSEPATRPTVQARQSAVRELSQRTDWRQTFQAYGRQNAQSKADPATLLTWIQEPPALPRRGLYTTLCFGLASLTTVAIVLYFVGSVPSFVPLLLLLINGVVLWSTAQVAADMHRKTTQSVAVLNTYQQMMRSVETETFDSERMQQLRSVLVHEEAQASQEIDQLRYILANLDQRGNQFYHLFNIIWLLDVYWLLRADRWKSQLQGNVAQWFDSMSEIEALGSLASFTFAHPSYTFPTIVGQQFRLHAEGLGHCLIPSGQRVTNDFTMSDRGTITIITGSNMSGKSTFLRTVGINVVLALAGAPVCAQVFEISEMQVFASMRTQDSLEENVSSFYAELRRLRQLLDMLRAPARPVLFMLDEILKGTNSHDRHHGAASLVKQLSQLEATGFVSTHDLALGKLEESLPQVKNYSFTSTIERDEIYFDYQLREGVCQSFNASKLMAKMGIAVEE